MGIKYLWNILTPFCERKPLYELQGKTVAVDLSCWICEAQNISEYQVQPKMYLRNLYFRASFLLLMDVHPVFVLEGKAPELKYDTIAARNAIQFKGAKPKKEGVKTGKDRSRFHYVLKQCSEMLEYMGLACLTGKGEAESFCAYLNQEGFVHGCISQDSDCFAYGAQVVYRNFSISSQGSHAASGGAVDVYDIQKVTSDLDFGRNKIIALALLCGSDYSSGVEGVGKDSSLKFFEKYTDEQILDRMREWRHNPSIFEDFEKKLADKDICTSCGHFGKIQSHNKKGCISCGTSSGCDFSKYKDERLVIKNEVNIRNKALQDENFPNEDLIKEYLTVKDKVSSVDLKWRQPDLVKFVKFTAKHLGWEEVYSFEKFVPILTRWQILNYDSMETLRKSQRLRGILHPSEIKKIRKPKGVPSYEIRWNDEENFFEGLIPNSQLLEIKDMEKFWSTIEPQSLVDKAYPKLVEEFHSSRVKHKKVSRKKNRGKIDDLNESLNNLSLSEPVVKKVKKNQPKKVKKTTELTRRISQYFKDNVNDLGKNYEFTSTPIRNKKEMIPFEICNDDDLEITCFDDCGNSDISDIVDEILANKIPNGLREKLGTLGYSVCDNENEEPVDSASFFVNSVVGEDLFEKTFDHKYLSSDEDAQELSDDFCEIKNIPLVERIKNKIGKM